MSVISQNTITPISFSADGIRGISGNWPFTPAGIEMIGTALVEFVYRSDAKSPTIFLGRDTRRSGKQYSKILKSCFIGNGITVIDLDIAPTPVIAYLAKKYSAQLGVIVSASHNPEKYNGVKLVNSMGLKLRAAEEQLIEKSMILPHSRQIRRKSLLIREDYPNRNLPQHPESNLENQQKFIDEYIEDHIDMMGAGSLSNLKIVTDCANGAVSRTGKNLLNGLGASVVSLYNDVSGVGKINDLCGSEYYRMNPEKLTEIVRKNKADYGLAFDGDGDRVVIVDNNNNYYNGDDLLYALASIYNELGLLPGNKVVITSNSNSGLEKSLSKIGVEALISQNGDKNLESAIWKNNLLLGAEQVGNIIINDGSHGAADSLFATSLLLTLLRKRNETLEELVDTFKKDAQILVSVHMSRNLPETEIMRATKEIAHTEAPKLNVRTLHWHSSTEPGLFNLMVEVENSENVQMAINLAKAILDKTQQFHKEHPKVIDLSTRKRKQNDAVRFQWI